MGCAWCRDDKLDAFASIEDVKKGDVVVIDCSQNKDAEKSYKLQRVKDAHWLGADWSLAKTPADIKDKMAAIGVGSDDHVVLYDQTNGSDAMAAAAIMASSGMKSVRVLKGKWEDDKDYKKADKDQDAVKKGTAKGAAFTKVDAALTADAKALAGKQVIDMREKADFDKEKYVKEGSFNVSLAKFWDAAKRDVVVEATVDKDIADLKLKREDATVIVGGGDNSFAMWWCLRAAGFKQVAIYAKSLEEHKVKPAEEPASKEAQGDGKAAEGKKDEKAAQEQAPAETKAEDKPAAEPKTDAAPETAAAEPTEQPAE